MLLEAPQIWRMKRYNVLETELVYMLSVCKSKEVSGSPITSLVLGVIFFYTFDR